jgi:hypothetical protein
VAGSPIVAVVVLDAVFNPRCIYAPKVGKRVPSSSDKSTYSLSVCVYSGGRIVQTLTRVKQLWKEGGRDGGAETTGDANNIK